MLRNLATLMLDEYKMANTKFDKSLIISDAAERIREKGNFVRRHTTTEKWAIAEELLCREKVSAVFRDALRQRRRKDNSVLAKSTLHQTQGQRKQAFATRTPSSSGMEEEQINRVVYPLSAIDLTYRPASPSLIGLERPSIANVNDWVPLPRLGPQSSEKNDGFSIFAIAFANLAEDGDPFEPKPFYEGPASLAS
jgi:hypothetical protein